MKYRGHKELRPLAFFRNMDLQHLESIIQERNPHFFDEFDQFNQDVAQTIFDKYSTLPEKHRDDLESIFSQINDIATEKGMYYLVEACDEFKIDYDVNATPFQLASFLYKQHRKTFEYAFEWYNIDLCQSFKDFLGSEPKELNEKGLSNFESTLKLYLNKQAKGHNLQVDVYPKSNKIAYIVSFENYNQPTPKFKDEKLEIVIERPVKEIVLLYYPNLAKLKVFAPTEELIEKAKILFAEHLLGNKNFFINDPNQKLLDLKKLANMKTFSTNPVDNIEYTKITSIVAMLSPDQSFKASFYSNKDLHRYLKEYGINLYNVPILKVGIKFKFKGKGNNGSRTVYLSMPNTTTLSDAWYDEIIAKYLVYWEVLNV